MARKITAHEATIHTATVEVRTLTISGRQVTLSVFRQLQNEPIIDWPTMKLNGVPWGRVNYCPDKSCDFRKHTHAVWQNGSELRRSSVFAPISLEETLAVWGERDAWEWRLYRDSEEGRANLIFECRILGLVLQGEGSEWFVNKTFGQVIESRQPEIGRRVNAYAALYASLLALPQLFIAT